MKSRGVSNTGPRNVQLGQVVESFRKQGVMRLLGGEITKLRHGLVEITAKNRPGFSQQDGFVHAGIMATLADNCAGYATLSRLPSGSRVLAVEFKLNFIRPGIGELIRGRARVRRLGKTLSVCEVYVEMRQEGKWVACAWGSETVYCIRAKED
ncbi:PaaI family thioesterase [Candidatus Bathyarchaeota archaeon]|nr:PaaI family thioesterase [Candidatus Bathyarchaeota archaeon]